MRDRDNHISPLVKPTILDPALLTAGIIRCTCCLVLCNAGGQLSPPPHCSRWDFTSRSFSCVRRDTIAWRGCATKTAQLILLCFQCGYLGMLPPGQNVVAVHSVRQTHVHSRPSSSSFDMPQCVAAQCHPKENNSSVFLFMLSHYATCPGWVNDPALSSCQKCRGSENTKRVRSTLVTFMRQGSSGRLDSA